ncbi:family 43 glycosylhydrolase [Ruania alkalisoli]|uniref:Family 43 glycosylhydrolase n=1 Tax=Ruania alkalisoli TaxID=2779775 RepID=A0A7M1ST50_9MICO|nr:glycoside hydrolase family 43 protein [Ruania alkalisoli]QOR70631.1 family 43 glycosylhydrolase [Ruania alkalisoli]
MPRLAEIQIRDPFVLPTPDGEYYLYGSTDANIWSGPGTGFDTYRSTDLEHWEGPIPAFRPPPGFVGTTQFWAPEVYAYRGRYVMFATVNGPEVMRGTHALIADTPAGPFQPHSDGALTPPAWQCLDGTLFVDADGDPWMVFCQEWQQVHDGGMHAVRLTPDLRAAAGRPQFLFNASEAPWARDLRPSMTAEKAATYRFACYVTDGPFLHRTPDGTLLMLWSTMGATGYTMGLARSSSGHVTGPWEQLAEPLWDRDGGHGMVLRTHDGRLLVTWHEPNDTPNERAVLREIVEDGGRFRLV